MQFIADQLGLSWTPGRGRGHHNHGESSQKAPEKGR
jgi:hypothetical protein